MSTLETFCRQVRARSEEHQKAMTLLHTGGVLAQVKAILRQELDWMVCVIYLLSISDLRYRDELIRA